MGAAIFLSLVAIVLVVIGFLVYGMFLGLAALGQTLRRVWLAIQPVETTSVVMPGGYAAAIPLGARVPVAASSRCWDAKRCPPEAKLRCPAVAHPDEPCWAAWMQSRQYRLKPECLACDQFSLERLLGQR